MNGILRVPRTRGALSGLLLVLLGAWGALVPFIGPSFHYAYTPDKAWAYTSGRLWLEILPGAATLLGGLVMLASAYRPVAHLGAWLAALSGAWFALGGILGQTWSGINMNPGTPVGGTTMRAFEQIGFFTGLGVAIVAVAAMAAGRFSVISVRDARRAEKAAAAPEPSASTEETKTPARAGGTRFTLALPVRRKGASGTRPATGKRARAGAETERIDSAAASR
jgi:hypothetical protein